MRIFITAGNTQTPIDRVRCITNIFTGRTGAAIALEAHHRGHHVTLATSHPETIDETPPNFEILAYRTFDELEAIMEHQIARHTQDAVVHCAAVSDYHAAGVFAPAITTRFHPDGVWLDDANAPTLFDRSAGKIKSDEPELWLRLVRAPKLVDKIRSEWSFSGSLVKFKLEVGITEEALLAIAEKSRQHSQADWMVANTLDAAKEWALVGNAAGYRKVLRDQLAGVLLDALEEGKRHG